VVDAGGAPVPLHEACLHPWIVEPYHVAVGVEPPKRVVAARNSGVCGGALLGQYYGLGTATWVPDPYGVEVGCSTSTPSTPADRRLGCTECRCDLYGVTVDERGRALARNYTGGLYCCYDGTRCRVEADGFGGGDGMVRVLFLRYTVTWLDWSDAVVPVRIYIFDVTDTALLEGKSQPACKVLVLLYTVYATAYK
jgi:hypothetical protein